jgi:hypothetical protein
LSVGGHSELGQDHSVGSMGKTVRNSLERRGCAVACLEQVGLRPASNDLK